MSEPSKKSPAMEDALQRMFGRTTAIKADVCVLCKKPATKFRDALSRKEYAISGMCQDCQDKVFGTGEE